MLFQFQQQQEQVLHILLLHHSFLFQLLLLFFHKELFQRLLKFVGYLVWPEDLDRFEFFLVIYDFADSERVDRAVARIKIEHRRIDDTVSRIIEIIRYEHTRNLDHAIFIDEDRAEDSALSFDAMWRGRERHFLCSRLEDFKWWYIIEVDKKTKTYFLLFQNI